MNNKTFLLNNNAKLDWQWFWNRSLKLINELLIAFFN